MSAGLEVADVFRRHGDAYRRAHDGHLGRVERRVMSAIELCRTAALGGHTEACADCGLVRCAYNSCRNRHCPKCQGQARAEWLAARQAELLPVPYFHRRLHPAGAGGRDRLPEQGDGLRHPVPDRGRDTAHDRRRSQASRRRDRPVAVLHTWGQNLHHHPHVHCVVPGGGPSLDGTRWVACRPGFFLPVRVLSRLFRRLFLDELRAAFAAGARLLRRACRACAARRLRPPAARTASGSNGWSMPSRPSAAPSRCWPISAAIRIASPSPTAPGQLTEPGRLPLEGLSPPRQVEDHDPRRRRVHPPLSAAHPAGRLPSHPPLRLPRQWPPRRQAGALPQAARRRGPRTRSRSRPATAAIRQLPRGCPAAAAR